MNVVGDLNEAANKRALMFAEYFLSLQVKTVRNLNEEPFQPDIVINVLGTNNVYSIWYISMRHHVSFH